MEENTVIIFYLFLQTIIFVCEGQGINITVGVNHDKSLCNLWPETPDPSVTLSMVLLDAGEAQEGSPSPTTAQAFVVVVILQTRLSRPGQEGIHRGPEKDG